MSIGRNKTLQNTRLPSANTIEIVLINKTKTNMIVAGVLFLFWTTEISSQLD